MTRKRDVERPYQPIYVSAETTAYLLDISRDTLEQYVRLGILPEPLDVGSMRRWRWEDVDAWILAANGRGAGPAANPGLDSANAGDEASPFAARIRDVVGRGKTGTAADA